MGSVFFLLIVIVGGFLIWLGAKLSIWIIKTAIKEALREYDAEKHGQS